MLPDPTRQDLTGWIFQPIDLIEVMVVKTIIEWLEGLLDVGKVHYPAGLFIHLARDINCDLE